MGQIRVGVCCWLLLSGAGGAGQLSGSVMPALLHSSALPRPSSSSHAAALLLPLHATASLLVMPLLLHSSPPCHLTLPVCHMLPLPHPVLTTVGPFLTPLYGCGELPQAFCRSAAVAGAVQVCTLALAWDAWQYAV